MKPNLFSLRSIEWILRIGVAGTFIGHGCTALMVKPSWIPLLTTIGFSVPTSITLMQIIGGADLVIALIVLFWPNKPILYWCIFWTFLTALMRFISGEPIFEFIERFANIACPLTLLFLLYKRNRPE